LHVGRTLRKEPDNSIHLISSSRRSLVLSGVQMIGFGISSTSGTIPAVALGLLFILITPQWALLLWAASSSHQLKALLRSTSPRLLAVTCWGISAAVGSIGPIWVNNVFIGSEQVELHRIVENCLLAQIFLLGTAVLIVASRHKTATGPPVPPANRNPPPRALLIVLVAWAAAAGVAIALALGPLSGQSAEVQAWLALALALAVIAVLIGMLVNSLHKARRDATKRAGGSAGSI
jgi:hypothetical protein